MIKKVIAIVILALITLYIASYLHLLSFASLVPYGVFVPSAPNNLNASSFVNFLKQAFALR